MEMYQPTALVLMHMFISPTTDFMDGRWLTRGADGVNPIVHPERVSSHFFFFLFL